MHICLIKYFQKSIEYLIDKRKGSLTVGMFIPFKMKQAFYIRRALLHSVRGFSVFLYITMSTPYFECLLCSLSPLIYMCRVRKANNATCYRLVNMFTLHILFVYNRTNILYKISIYLFR